MQGEQVKTIIKNVQDKAQSEEVVEKGVLTRNQALTRTMNRPNTVLKRQRLNRQDLNACLKAEDQKRKEDAEMWLKVRCASFMTSFVIIINHMLMCIPIGT